MPWQWGWPPYVSPRVAEDRHRAVADLEQSSGDLKETIEHVQRTQRIASTMRQARDENHFSESMERLFTTHARARGREPR